MWENYSGTFSEITYVPTFIQIKKRCEEKRDTCSNAYLKASSASLEEEDINGSSQQTSSTSSSPIQNAQWRKEKEYDNDEAFFSRDDDEVCLHFEF